MTPIPENLNNVLYVATNDPILVGIEGQDLVIRKDVGGYYLVHKEDFAVFLDALKMAKENKK